VLVDTIINNIKLKAGFPDDNYYSDAELLTLLNDEQKVTILPLIMKLHEDFLLQNETYTVTAGSTYRLPARAVGNKVRDVKLLVSSDYEDIERRFEEDRSQNLKGYYITRNSIELSDHYTSGTLVVTYFMSLSDLILEASAAEVQSIDSATQVTVTALPSSITTSTPVDFMQANSPNDVLAIDQTITNIASTQLTFASLPDDLAVGDYICLAKQTPIPAIPEELVPVLTQAALVTALAGKKDRASEFEKKRLDEMVESMVEMLDTRSESNDVHIRPQGFLTYLRGRR
jgi:hypothetical protein